MKNCQKCKTAKKLDEFSKDKTRKDGFNTICKKCCKNRYESNREYNIKQNLLNRKKKEELYRETRKKRYILKKEELAKINKEWRSNNREYLKEYHRNYHNSKKKDPMYRLKRNLRGAVKRYITGRKSKRTFDIIGCSFQEFRAYIESKFQSWMSWNNYASINGKDPTDINQCWDIDHIIPLCSARTEKDIYSLNHYSNLQPMCSYINRWIKRDEYNENDNRIYSS